MMSQPDTKPLSQEDETFTVTPEEVRSQMESRPRSSSIGSLPTISCSQVAEVDAPTNPTTSDKDDKGDDDNYSMVINRDVWKDTATSDIGSVAGSRKLSLPQRLLSFKKKLKLNKAVVRNEAGETESMNHGPV